MFVRCLIYSRFVSKAWLLPGTTVVGLGSEQGYGRAVEPKQSSMIQHCHVFDPSHVMHCRIKRRCFMQFFVNKLPNFGCEQIVFLRLCSKWKKRNDEGNRCCWYDKPIPAALWGTLPPSTWNRHGSATGC